MLHRHFNRADGGQKWNFMPRLTVKALRSISPTWINTSPRASVKPFALG